MQKDKGREAKLPFIGHAFTENGNRLLVDFVVGTAERGAVAVMLDDAGQRGFHREARLPFADSVEDARTRVPIQSHTGPRHATDSTGLPRIPPDRHTGLEPISFSLPRGKSAALGGKPDLIVGKDSTGMVIDNKTGQPSPSHSVQVMIYMYAIPRALHQYRGITSTQDVPESHDGNNKFTFKLHFSEEPKESFSYKTLRDHAFTVTGGEVIKARRLERGKNVGWEITVQQDGDGTVTIVLPATTDCAAAGAICTEDDRKLSNRLEMTVSGP